MLLGLFKKKEKIPEYTVKLSYDKTMPFTKRNAVNFLRALGIDVRVNTKAKGNCGIYRRNRIDAARGLKDDKVLEVLVHEFAHYIHSRIDKDFEKTGGSLERLFDISDAAAVKKELAAVSSLIDKNDKMKPFLNAKAEISDKIKSMQKAVQRTYPEFQRSKKFAAFDKYAAKSYARYLVKYDAVKITEGRFFKKERILSVKNIETDFPDMPEAFKIYIKLCSLKRKQTKISRRINKMNKYFNHPSELFARFVQGYFFHPAQIQSAAPCAVKRFNELLERGYYQSLKDFFETFQAPQD